MNPSLFSAVPAGVFGLLVVFVLIAGFLVFCALRSKGDVRAQFSHGSTMFKLEAKESGRKKDTSRRGGG